MKKQSRLHYTITGLASLFVLAVCVVSFSATAIAGSFPGLNGRLLYSDTNNYANYQMVTVKADGTGSSAIGANDLARRYASFSPDGTKIVYTSGGSWQHIWIANADGSNAVQLTSGNTNGIYPSFSPDGTKILYSNAVPSIYQLWTMNLDGTGATVLSAQAYHMYRASYSPDGTKIVFSSPFGAVDSEVGIMNSDGTGITNLTNNSQHDDDPSFSPDGTKIVYNSLALTGGAEYQIHTMNLAGGNNVQLTSTAVYHGGPVYSPDGTKIAYRRGSSPVELYYMNADGSNETRVTTNGWADDKLDWQPLTLGPAASTSNPSFSLVNGKGTLDIASLYTDPYGDGINKSSITITSAPTQGTTNVNTTTGVITYTQNDVAVKGSFFDGLASLFFPKVSAATTDSFGYRVCSTTNSALCSTGTASVLGLSTLTNTGDNVQLTSSLAVGLMAGAIWVFLRGRRERTTS